MRNNFKLKTPIRFLLFILNICILTSCTSNINFNEIIDKNKALELRISKNDSSFPEHFEIPAHSEKFIRLTKWADNNTTGWESSFASYKPEVFVGQGNFRLLYWTGKDGVIIGFTDKGEKPRQYSKKIEKGELDFLVK